MPVAVEATLEGEQQLNRRLMIMSDGIEDWREPLTNIGGELLRSIDQNYSARGGMFGGWPARKDDNPWPLLEKTGEMRGNFRDEVGSDFVEITNPTPQFPFHQSNQPRERLPRRVMMKIDAERKNYIVKQFQEHIINVIRNSKRG